MSECMTQEDAECMDNEQAIAILKPLRDMMCDQYGCPISDAYFALDKAITALLQPQRMKGKWVNLQCTQCGQVDTTKPNFCPCCGADMRGESDE